LKFPRFNIEIKLISFLNVKKGYRIFNRKKTDTLLFFGSGAEALTFYLREKVCKKGKIVVGVPLYVCHSVYHSIISANCELKYIDFGIGRNGYNVDIKNLDDIDAFVIVHYFGVIYENIKLLRESYPDLIIIEDCSHLDFREYTCNPFSNTSFFSFNFHKPVSAGGGGALIINEVLEHSLLLDEWNKLPKLSLVNQGVDFIKTIILNYSYLPLLYRIVYKKLENKRSKPKPIDVGSKIIPKKISTIRKWILGNQLVNQKSYSNYYYLLNENFIFNLEILKKNSLSYYPIFIKTLLAKEQLSIIMNSLGIDLYILWENVYFNSRSYFQVDYSNYTKTKMTVDSILFLPSVVVNNKHLISIVNEELIKIN
jgi:hypothetical protein